MDRLGRSALQQYTHPQRATFKDVYARRFRKQLVMMVLLFVVTGAFAFADTLGLPEGVLALIFVLAAVCWVIVHGRNWRCPACQPEPR
jgi:hypothetical protein